jgi:hypothetical protein
MELGILAGVGALGYLLNQRERENNFEANNQLQLQDYLKQHPRQQQLAMDNNYGYENSCADSYPLYKPEYVKHQQKMLSGLGPVKENTPKENTLKKNTPKENTPKEHVTEEEFGNFIPANDPTSDQLLDLKERPLTDFYHANMVPFYGSNVKQNMAGTGVASGSYIDGSGVNSGFDDSTPFQTQLGTYTGMDDTYLHKREVGPMFSPAEQQTNWVNGMPLFRPDIDRYTQGLSNIRNDLRPVESEQIGPGLNLDPKIPASGGFHDFTRILPNNVNNYKANQLPGQVITGKYFSTGLPTSYPGVGVSGDKEAPGVVKNRPNSFWDQTRLPTMTTKVAFQNNLDYNIPDYTADFKPNNAQRDQQSYGLGNLQYKENKKENKEGIVCVDEEVSVGQGPLGAHIPQSGTRSETWMSMDNNIRSKADCNSQPIGNPQRSAFGHGNIVANWYVNETDRGTVNPQNVMQLNLNTQVKNGTFWTAEDEARTTNKETTEFSYAGNTSRPRDGATSYTYVDEPKTRTAETTIYSYAGNTSRPRDGATFYTYVDEPRTTTKDTTSFSYSANPTIPGFADTNRSMFTGFDVYE